MVKATFTIALKLSSVSSFVLHFGVLILFWSIKENITQIFWFWFDLIIRLLLHNQKSPERLSITNTSTMRKSFKNSFSKIVFSSCSTHVCVTFYTYIFYCLHNDFFFYHLKWPDALYLPSVRLWAFCQSSEHSPCFPKLDRIPGHLRRILKMHSLEYHLKPNKDLGRKVDWVLSQQSWNLKTLHVLCLGNLSQDWPLGAAAIKHNLHYSQSNFLCPFILSLTPLLPCLFFSSAFFFSLSLFHHHILSSCYVLGTWHHTLIAWPHCVRFTPVQSSLPLPNPKHSKLQGNNPVFKSI